MNDYGNNKQMDFEPLPCGRRVQPRQYGDMRQAQQYPDMMTPPRQGTTTMTAGTVQEPMPELPPELYPTQRGGTPRPRGFSQGAPPVTEIYYIPGYLASVIGQNIKAEFVVGSNQYVEKTGMLIDVGVNYFVLLDNNTRTTIMCDLYAVKFVTVAYS